MVPKTTNSRRCSSGATIAASGSHVKQAAGRRWSAGGHAVPQICNFKRVNRSKLGGTLGGMGLSLTRDWLSQLDSL